VAATRGKKKRNQNIEGGKRFKRVEDITRTNIQPY
jgi:hypothetical protein